MFGLPKEIDRRNTITRDQRSLGIFQQGIITIYACSGSD